jgi:two-component system sensor histidine kinase YesM
MRKFSLKVRLLSVLLPATILIVFSVYMMSERMVSSIMQQQAAERTLQMLEQIERSITQDIKKYSYTAASICNDQELQELFIQVYKGTTRYDTRLKIRQRLDGYFNYSDRVLSVIFIFKNDNMYNYLLPPSNRVSEIKKMPWYQKSLKSGSNLTILGKSDNLSITPYSSYMFSMAYRPEENYIDSGVEMVYFALVDRTFENIYKSYELNKVGQIAILDNTGSVIGTQDGTNKYDTLFRMLWHENLFNSPYGYFKSGEKNTELVTYYKSVFTGWTLTHIISSETLDQNVDRITRTIMFMSIAVMLILAGITFLLVGKVTKPLEKLTVQMRNFCGRDTDIIIENIRTSDECMQLTSFFNKMADEISRLIEDVERTEKRRARAEITALQYQISPHFILNTLNAIRTMAVITGSDPRVKEMLSSFSGIINGCLSDISSKHTLFSEKEYLTNYLYIMKIRYGAVWTAEIDFPEKLYDAKILKFLLQPLVENCILHGLSNQMDNGRIRISACEENNLLLIEVWDNGIGMKKEQIESILNGEYHKSSGFNRIGIYNVFQRIKLNYPDDIYGAGIESDNDGTRIILTLPLTYEIDKYEKEDAYVQGNDC